jgi:hypothetical protein
MDCKESAPPSTTQTLRNPASKKSAPPSTTQTLRNPAQNTAKPCVKKKRPNQYHSNPAKPCAEHRETLRQKEPLHPVQLKPFMPGSYYNRLRKSLIQWWLMDDSIIP